MSEGERLATHKKSHGVLKDSENLGPTEPHGDTSPIKVKILKGPARCDTGPRPFQRHHTFAGPLHTLVCGVLSPLVSLRFLSHRPQPDSRHKHEETILGSACPSGMLVLKTPMRTFTQDPGLGRIAIAGVAFYKATPVAQMSMYGEFCSAESGGESRGSCTQVHLCWHVPHRNVIEARDRATVIIPGTGEGKH